MFSEAMFACVVAAFRYCKKKIFKMNDVWTSLIVLRPSILRHFKHSVGVYIIL